MDSEVIWSESQMDGVWEMVNSGMAVKSVDLWSEMPGSLAAAMH